MPSENLENELEMLEVSFDPVEAAEITKGREAWGRIKTASTWGDWVLVGRALDLGRRECVRMAHMNQRNGSGYNSIFSQWLKENGFSDINKVARAQLFTCFQNLATIEAWLAALPLLERLRLNHPTTVWDQFEAAGRATRSMGTDGPTTLQAETAPEQVGLDGVQRSEPGFEAGRDNVSKGWGWTQHIAAAVLRLQPTKAKHLRSALLEPSKSTTPSLGPAKRNFSPREIC